MDDDVYRSGKMPKSARVKRIDGDKSDLPYVVQTPSNDLVRISVRQASALYNVDSAGYDATLEHVKRAASQASVSSEGFYFKSFPFPRSPQLANWIYRSIGKHISSRGAAAFGACLGVFGFAVFLLDGEVHTLRSASETNGLTLIFIMVIWDFVIILLHELGHAMTLIRFGQPIRAMGICFYFGSPTFYTDSTLALLLTKRQRIIQSGAGVWVDFVLAGILSIVLAVVQPEGTIGTVVTNATIFTYLAGWVNLAPIMKLDGYWMLSDALGRPQLMKEGFLALRSNWRSRIGLYGLLSALATAGLVLGTFFFWNSSFHRVLLPTWNQSVTGKIFVVFFAFLSLFALIGPLVAGFNERRRRKTEDLVFEAEHDDRVRAAEVWDELGWEPEFTGEELGVIAGAFDMIAPAPGDVLTTSGRVSAGVFVVLATEPYIIGLESVSGAASKTTVELEGDEICAFLPAAQARLFVGSHKLAKG